MRRPLFSSLLLALLCCALAPALARAGDIVARLPFDQDQQLKRERARITPKMVYHGAPVMTGVTRTSPSARATT
jgi:hypothetical protein